MQKRGALVLFIFLFLVAFANSSFASNTFYFNESEAETSTTSTTFVNKTTLAITTEAAPYLIVATGEIRGAVNTADVLARLLIDGTTDYGNVSFQPDTTGDIETFMFMRVVNSSAGSHTAALQYAAESGQTTYLKRARIFATKLDNYFYAENESETTPSTTGTDITTLTFTPAEAGNYLIVGTAEISAGSVSESIGVNLSIDNSVVNTVSNLGETTTDFESFAGQNTTYLTAASHTIKIVAIATAGTTQKIRRARIVAIRLPENFRNFFNESSTQSSTQATTWQQKVSLLFTPPVTGTYFIIGSSDIWSSSATNGAYVDVNLTIDGTEYGFTSVGLSDISDRLTFVSSKPINLTNASHNVTIYFRQTESVTGTPTVFIRNARINALGPDDRPNVETPLTYNSTLSQKSNFSIAKLVRIRVNVSDAAGASDISQVLINITKPNGTINVTNALMSSIASITKGFTYEYNFTIPSEASSVGVWNISIVANDTINAKGSNRTNFTATQNAPSITLSYPINNTQINNTQTVNFNFTAIDDLNTTLSCSIYLDGTLNQTNSSMQNNTLTNFLIIGISYGSHNWSVNCTDGSLSNISETRYFSIVDTQLPSITIVSPLATTYNYSNILVNISASDNVAVDKIWFNWNGTNESYTAPVYVNFTPDGTYTLYVYANDTSNNINSTNVTFTVNTTVADTTPPAISNVNATNITNQSATITWDTDELSNSTVNYGTTLALGSYATNSSLVTSHSIPLAGLTNSTLYYYNVTSCDASGNCNTSGPFNFTTLQNNDTTPPAISNVNATNITNQSATITWDTDELSNSTVNYGTTLALGSYATNSSLVTSHSIPLAGLTNSTLYYYNVTSCDASGNCNTSGPFNFTTLQNNDTIPPSINLLSPNNGAIDGDGTIYFNCSSSDNVALFNISLYLNGNLNQSQSINGTSNQTTFTLAGLSNGNYNWSCLVYDAAGNYNQSETRNLTVNTSAVPIYNTSYFAGNTTNWSAVPDLQNICNGTAVLDVPNVGAIIWNGCVNASYQDFNTNVKINYNNITVEFGLNPSFNSSATIEIKNLSWEDVPDIYKDGVLCPLTECTDLGYLNGVVTFNVVGFTSYTTAGNAQLEIWDETDSGMPYAGFTRYVNESVKFFANYTKVANGNPITGATCNINFTDLNALMSYNTTKKLYEYNRSFLTNGTFLYNVTCDAPGFELLTTNDSVLISADNITPNLTIQSPVNNSVYATNNISLNYTASDNVGIDKCWFINPNGTNTALSGCTNTTFIANEGSNNITVYVNDTSNNINYSQIFFTVDTQNPVINFVSPTPSNNASINKNYVFVNATVENGVSAIENCTLNFNGTIYNMTKIGTGNSVICSYNVTGLSEGTYQYNITANDSAGNIGNSSTRTLNIDFTAPGTITDLNETQTGTNYILWNWTNPSDFDFNHSEVWINGTFKANVSVNYYNATSLSPNTTYEIQIRTVDNAGNINTTWVNDSAITNVSIVKEEEKIEKKEKGITRRSTGGIVKLGNKTETEIISTCIAKEQLLYFYIKNRKIRSELIELTNESAVLLVNEMQYGFKNNEIRILDTDNNGMDDLKINLTRLRASKACFEFFEIMEVESVKPPIEKEPEFVNITEEKPAKIEKRYLWLWFVVIFAIAGIIVISSRYINYLAPLRIKGRIIVIKKNRFLRLKDSLRRSLLFVVSLPSYLFRRLFEIKLKKKQIISDSMIFERKKVPRIRSPELKEGGFRRIRTNKFFEWLFSFGGTAVNVRGSIIVIKKNKYELGMIKKLKKIVNKIRNFFSSQETTSGTSMEIITFTPSQKITPKEFEERIIRQRVWEYDKSIKPKVHIRKESREKMTKEKIKQKESTKRRILNQLKEVYRL